MSDRDRERPVVILLGGVPGTGKDIVCRRMLQQYPWVRPLRDTTRLPGEDEEDDVDYRFHMPKAYRRLVSEGQIQGDHSFCGNRYGYRMMEIKNHLKAGRTQVGSFGRNALDVKKEIPRFTITIYLWASIESITRRLYEERHRESEDEIWWRIGRAIRDGVREKEAFDYVVNSDRFVDLTLKDIERCLKDAEHVRGFRIAGFHRREKSSLH